MHQNNINLPDKYFPMSFLIQNSVRFILKITQKMQFKMRVNGFTILFKMKFPKAMRYQQKTNMFKSY